MIVSKPSKAELLSWVTDITKTPISRLQQLSDGIQFCQIFDKIYPKLINLNKLKRDPKVPLEKEKNFRLLLNAINHIQLSVAMNISDLANGKVTSLLQFLQWIFKECKKPSVLDKKNDGIQQKFVDSRVIKAYVPNLISRQKSSHKLSEKSKEKSLTSRKSLDTKSNQQKAQQSTELQSLKKSRHKSECKSELRSSVTNEVHGQSQKKERFSSQLRSKSKSINIKKGDFDELLQQKKQSMIKLKSEKKNHKEQDIYQVLKETMSFSVQKMNQKLIRVTQTVLENNPQLKEKIKQALKDDQETQQQKPTESKYCPPSQMKSVISSNQNTSMNCQSDSTREVEMERVNPDSQLQNFDSNSKNQSSMEMPSISAVNLSQTQTTLMDKKDTVKKSSMKLKQERPYNQPMTLSQHVIKQISAQKQKAQAQHHRQHDQNKPINQISMNNPILKLQNRQRFVTEKKPDSKKSLNFLTNQRLVQSQNVAKKQERTQTDFLKQNQKNQQVLNGQNQNPESAHPQSEGYPDLPAFQPSQYSLNSRFF